MADKRVQVGQVGCDEDRWIAGEDRAWTNGRGRTAPELPIDDDGRRTADRAVTQLLTTQRSRTVIQSEDSMCISNVRLAQNVVKLRYD